MQKLIDGLMKQLVIYEKLLEKTLAGKEAFTNNNNELFMSILSERLALMNDINLIEEGLKPLRKEWIENKESFSNEINEKVIGIVKIIKELMDKVLALEGSVIDEIAKQQQPVTSVPRAKAVSSYKKI